MSHTLSFKRGPSGIEEVLVLHCKTRHVGKQTWVRGSEAARQGSAFGVWGGVVVVVRVGVVEEDLMDNSTARQRQSFHLKMVPGLSQKVRAQNTNTLH